MDNELLIVKAAGGELNFQHFFDVIGQLHASKFSITIFNGVFQIKLPNAERIQSVNWDDITIRDDSTGGTIYNPTSIEQLVTILVAIKYTAYYTVSVNDIVIPTFQQVLDASVVSGIISATVNAQMELFSADNVGIAIRFNDVKGGIELQDAESKSFVISPTGGIEMQTGGVVTTIKNDDVTEVGTVQISDNSGTFDITP